MIRILGSAKKLCGGLTRRDVLQIGGLGAFGLGLDNLLRWQESCAGAPALPSSTFGKAKACILLFPYGSPPQHETFDPKPEAPLEIRGDLGSIETSLPGCRICDYLPHVAEVMDRVTVVRSMTHPFPVHGVAYATSGIDSYDPSLEVNPRDPRQWPYVGSCVDYVLEGRAASAMPELPRNVAPEVPRNIVLPWRMNSHNGGIATAGPYAAFLGPGYDPVVTDFAGEASRTVQKISPANGPVHDVADPFAGVKPDCHFHLEGSQAGPAAMTLDHLDRRHTLLEQFEQARRQLNADERTRGYDRFRQMTFEVLAGAGMHAALDVRREPQPLRERYGMTLFGQACLAARRLVEAGGKFVTVFWDEFGPINTDWDTHWDHYPRLKDRLLPGFDRAFAALLLDLDERGLLDETLVIWMSEHGRTPKLNRNQGGGRDHWSRVYSIVLAGGGVARGRVVGQSDALGGEVESTPVSPKDILATVFYLLGIDPQTTVPDRLGRLLPIAGNGSVRPEFF